MGSKLYKAFDDCLKLMGNGETIEACLAEYPHLRSQLVPLLHDASSIAAVPRLSSSDEFRKLSKARLITRLQERSIQAEKARSMSSWPGTVWGILERIITGPARVAIPVTLVLALALQGLFLFGTARFSAPATTPALSAQCTLSDLTGNAELQVPGSSAWEEAKNGVTLQAGSRVRTSPDSSALLTFFNGTTIELEPGTDLVVKQLETGSQNQPTVIVLKQWLGRTVNRVTRMADPGSLYGIETSSAYIMVRGTVFSTEVDETGKTTVQTFKGLVSVSAEGKEVYLPAGQQTEVEPGVTPSEPVQISYIEGEGAPVQSQEEPTEKAAVTAPLPERGDSSGTAPADSRIEGAPARSTDGEEPSGKGQEGMTASGEDGEQGPPVSIPGGNNTMYQDQKEYIMWILIGIILCLFSTLTILIMWRKIWPG